jgi:hypothetical protein
LNFLAIGNLKKALGFALFNFQCFFLLYIGLKATGFSPEPETPKLFISVSSSIVLLAYDQTLIYIFIICCFF